MTPRLPYSSQDGNAGMVTADDRGLLRKGQQVITESIEMQEWKK